VANRPAHNRHSHHNGVASVRQSVIGEANDYGAVLVWPPIVERPSRYSQLTGSRNLTGRITNRLMVPALVGAVGAALACSDHAERLKPFRGRAAEYLSQADRAQQLNKVHTLEYINGKLVTVSLQTRDIDDMFLGFSDDLRPSTPEDVRSVALLDCPERIVGEYQPKGSRPTATTLFRRTGVTAVLVDCTVRVIDITVPMVSATKVFSSGGAPAELRLRTKQPSITFDNHDGAITQFLAELPRSAESARQHAYNVAAGVNRVRLAVNCRSDAKGTRHEIRQTSYALPGFSHGDLLFRQDGNAIPVTVGCNKSTDIVAGEVQIQPAKGYECTPTKLLIDNRRGKVEVTCGAMR
jgi:hypothetical protein